tara:strand:- start:3138 stop:3560 length:423 start_codon:yes stop_codon:yes gene_type:complete
MDKICTGCKEVKPLEQFHKHALGKFGRQPKCKECTSKRYLKHRTSILKNIQDNKEYFYAKNKEYTESKKDGLYHVYTIDDYAGYTTRPDTRKQEHKNKGRDGNTFKVIKSFYTLPEALEFEALLHSSGFTGRHINASSRS